MNGSGGFGGGGLLVDGALALTGTQCVAYRGLGGRPVSFLRPGPRGERAVRGQCGGKQQLGGGVSVLDGQRRAPARDDCRPGVGKWIGDLRQPRNGWDHRLDRRFLHDRYHRGGGTAYENYNLFYVNGTNHVGSTGGTNDVVSGDPRFVDPSGDDYHLGAGSAAIDVGVDVGVTSDLDGDPRPRGGGFDIGAYEAAPAPFVVLLPLVAN